MNGNITRLVRNGNSDGPVPFEIDNLDYSYDPANANRLLKVADGSNSPLGFKDGTNSGSDYAYDDFGNLTGDANKGMLSIGYNHLNLPANIVFGIGTNKISYLYDANGKKLRRSIPYAAGNAEGGYGAFAVEYLDGFQYESGALKFFPTSEGYVLKTGSAYSYVYNYTDHLGNVRLRYALEASTGDTKILEENHYYPFGLKHANYNSDQLVANEAQGRVSFKALAAPVSPVPPMLYNYKFNGMELQDEMGLNMTAMDFRQYDNAIGRFVGMDALSESGFSITPYHFGNNNPNFWADPTGLLSNDFITSIWNNSHGNSTTWTNNGGMFTSSSGSSETGFVGIDDDGTFYENLMNPVTVVSGSANGGIVIQNHVYSTVVFLTFPVH